MSRKHVSKFLNRCFSGDAGHHIDLYPFRMTIDNDQEHFPHKWPCEIDVNSLPWHRRPIEPVGACFVTFDNRYIAERSLLYLYQDWASRREVDTESSEGFHSDDPWMPCV